jgi:hypothetical protein
MGQPVADGVPQFRPAMMVGAVGTVTARPACSDEMIAGAFAGSTLSTVGAGAGAAGSALPDR